jgi:hypothetical protein
MEYWGLLVDLDEYRPAGFGEIVSSASVLMWKNEDRSRRRERRRTVDHDPLTAKRQ